MGRTQGAAGIVGVAIGEGQSPLVTIHAVFVVSILDACARSSCKLDTAGLYIAGR